ncbi:LysR family transcriptional regulator [Tumebacillus lipolyticus]|uniref:LysR family transcriptional regulator n=1 Tax=Tumebacillus lipolyticus TaxID=1280370 RepID=A0ABW4ZXB0_9BACL
MNLYALSIFTEVAKHRSVTRAAEALGLTQPAVTAQVRKLEKELGVTLLSPRGRGIQLTDVGEMLMGYAHRLFAIEREMELKVEDWKRGMSGSVRIGVSNLPAYRLLPSWIASFKRHYPDVEVKLITSNAQQVFDLLLEYRVDVGIVGGEHVVSAVEQERVFEEQYWFIVPKGHRLAGEQAALAEILEEPFLFREKGSTARETLLTLCREHKLPPPKVGLELNGTNEGIQAVRAGFGAMLVPSLLVREDVESGEVGRVYVRDVNLSVPIYLCTRAGESVSPSVRNLVEVVRR